MRQLLLLLPAVFLACGGAFASGDSGNGGTGGDSGSGDTGTQDGGPGQDATPGHDGGPIGTDASDSATPWSPVCPASAPAAGSPCTTENTQCEYGDAWWNVSCDTVVQCQNARWTAYQPSYVPCSAQPGPNAAACPATYAAVPQGSQCTAIGTPCYYAQAECTCQIPLGPPVEDDAGETGYWGCDPEPGCPMPRPRLGSACSSEGTYCTYEECTYGQTCSGGTWQGAEEACAGAGTGASP